VAAPVGEGGAVSDEAVLFPKGWRYNPLRWRDGEWINAIAYRSDQTFKGLGEFHGVDLDGVAHFAKKSVHGIPCVANGIPAVAATPGMAVGIFVRHCDPPLAIVDCDADDQFVPLDETGRRVRLERRLGRDQLLALFEERGEPLPPCPAVRGNREGHGYLIFQQNARCPISTRRIRPHGLALDLIGNGHQVHWSAPGSRALVAGAELLDHPPELPLWLARYIRGRREARLGLVVPLTGVGSGGLGAEGSLTRLQVELILRPVTPEPGAWNQRLFNAACCLAETGLPLDEVRRLVLESCGPTDDVERSKASASIDSAWRRVTGEETR
jgi:hypothetical protein